MEITQKQLYEQRNTSDVFTRLVIMGLLRILNKQLYYTQVWDDTEEGIENVTVPFFYDFSGGTVTSEKFIQDNYLGFTETECTEMGIRKVDGDCKIVPFGALSLGSTSIDSGNISNRFVMGQFTKRENGTLKSYVSFLYSIPLTYSFSVNIKCDTMNTLWKIEQAYREYFYKNKTYHINYKGTIVPVRVGFPESLSNEKTSQYSFGTGGNELTLTFDIAAETYQPVFDKDNEMPADNNIKYIGQALSINGSEPKGDSINVVSDLSGQVLPVGSSVLLEWKYNYEFRDLLAVELGYRLENEDDSTFHVLDIVSNHNFYRLTIMDDLVAFDNILIDCIIDDPDVNIIEMPQLRFYPDIDTSIVKETNVTVLNKGLIMTSKKQIEATLSYEGKNGKLIEKSIKLNILNNMIDIENPASFKSFVYNNKFKFKRMKLLIRDKYMGLNETSFCKDKDNPWITII